MLSIVLTRFASACEMRVGVFRDTVIDDLSLAVPVP